MSTTWSNTGACCSKNSTWGRAICPVVWIYYIWTAGRKKGDWGISRIIRFSKENEREMKGTRKLWISFFPVGDSQKSKRVFWEVYAWLGVSVKVATFFCHQVGQIWSYRAVIFLPCSKSRDLGPEHGFRACSFKNKEKKLDYHMFWGSTTKNKLLFSEHTIIITCIEPRFDNPAMLL